VFLAGCGGDPAPPEAIAPDAAPAVDQVSGTEAAPAAPAAEAATPTKTHAAVEGGAGTSKYADWTISWDAERARAVGSQGTSVAIFQPEPGVTHRVLSVVGPYVSFEREADGSKTWSVANVETPGEAADLRKVFQPVAIYNALRMDKGLDKALRGKKATDLASFLQALDGGCAMSLGPEMMSSFAFHGLDGNVVTVRVGVAHGCEIERGTFTEFDLRLPVGQLMSMLIPADAAGTLLEDR